MAIINCPECGKEISGQAHYCPYCGYPINVQLEQQEKPKRKKKWWVIGAVAVLLVALGIGSYLYFYKPKLSMEEQHVYNCVESYKRMLKDPDSLALRGPCVYLYTDDNKRVVLFTASAKNSYGGTVTNIQMFLNGKYIDEYDESFSDNIDMNKLGSDDEYSSHVKDVMVCQLAFLSWQLYGKNLTESETDYAIQVDGSVIARRVGCNYSD